MANFNFFRSAGLTSLATTASRIVGLVREQVFAYYFGAGYLMDAFNIAFRIPNLLRDLFAEGAMNSAFVPTYTKVISKENKTEQLNYFNTILTILTLVVFLVVIIGILSSDQLVKIFASTYHEIPGKFELTSALTSFLFPFILLASIAALFTGALNAHRIFFIPALSPVLFNVATILCGVFLIPVLVKNGYSTVYSIAIGVLVGGLLQILVQIPFLYKRGIFFRLKVSLKNPYVKDTIKIFLPALIGIAATEINIFVNTNFATSQEEGAVSWLNYSFRLLQFPIGVFGVAISTVTLPLVSRLVALNDNEGISNIVERSMKTLTLLALPCTVGLIVLATPIISMIYEHGKFTSLDTIKSADALIMYSIGLFGYSGIKILVPVFYAFQLTKIPVSLSFFNIISNIISNLIFIKLMGFLGLPLSTSIVVLLNFFLLLFFLKKRIKICDLKFLVFFLKVSLLSFLMGAFLYFLWYNLLATLASGHLLKALLLSVTICLGAGFYFLSSSFLKLNILAFLKRG